MSPNYHEAIAFTESQLYKRLIHHLESEPDEVDVWHVIDAFLRWRRLRARRERRRARRVQAPA